MPRTEISGLRRGALAAYEWLFTPAAAPDRRFWAVFWAAIAIAVVLGLTGLQAAFADRLSIQDDARQHIFWMRRFMEPHAFAGDAIADYFQTVSPWGVKNLYRTAAALGLNPLFFNKLLPLALGLVTAIYSVVLGWMMMPVPAAAGLGATLLQLSLWMRDDLVSGTAVAFAVPLMLPVLVHGFRNQRGPLAIALLALTGTYPQCALVMVATLTLGTFPDWWLMRRSPRQTRITVAIAWLIFILGALPFLLRHNPYGPVMTATEAQTLGTFAPKAWSSFFTNDAWNFWVCGQRSGILPQEWCRLMSNHSVLLIPLWSILALVLPIFIGLRRLFPLGVQLRPPSRLLGQLSLASLGCFALAHQLLFRLHLPNRYTEHSLRIVAAFGGGIAIALILERCYRTLINPDPDRPFINAIDILSGLIIFLTLITYPLALNIKNYDFPTTNYTAGIPSLHQFLRTQPPDSLVASLEKEADNIPALAGRSIYVGAKGYILPYHKGFYGEMVDRLSRLTAAQYSDRPETLKQFFQDSGITHWLINRNSFTEDYLDARQFRQFNLGEDIRQELRQGKQPILLTVLETCSVWSQDDLILVTTDCIAGNI